jgi:hypothetical protein
LQVLGDSGGGTGESAPQLSTEERDTVIGPVRRVVATASAASACSALGAVTLPVSAHAALVSVNACDNSTLSQPFTQWADFDYYKLAPGGDFEGALSGWTLSGGAGQGDGSESYGVTGAAGSSSLSLPDGSAAVSPATCVNAAYPTFRFFVRGDTPGAFVTESVIYRSAWGSVTIPSARWPPPAIGSRRRRC